MTDDQAEDAREAAAIQGPIGYQVLGVLGRGSTGLVFLARRPDGELVAVKRLVGDWVDDGVRARFFREARVLAQLDHPCIVRAEGLVEDSGEAFLVAEFVDGPTLERVLRAAPLTTAHALAVISYLADALGYAHERGVVHRDLTPANVLFSSSGEVKLADFGLAKILGPDRTTSVLSFRTDTGVLLGTPAFMSPEAAQGVVDLTPQADIYSLGVLAYRLIVGCLPFPNESDVLVTLEAHIIQPPPSPAKFGVKLPATLETSLLQALAKNPDDRQSSATDFWNDVAGAADVAWPHWRERIDLPGVVREVAVSGSPVPVAGALGKSLKEIAIPHQQASAGPSYRSPTKRIEQGIFVPRKRRRWPGLAISAAVGLCIAVAVVALFWSSASSPALTVRSVSVTEVPLAQSNRTCPVVVRLGGHVTTNGEPGRLTYAWSLPGVHRAPTQVITVQSGENTLSVFISAVADADSSTNAVLRILSPSPPSSASLRLRCT